MNAPRPAPYGGRLELHAHTHFSDGLLSPADLVERALAAGITALAITDHDSVEGIGPAIEAAADRLEIVPGIEVSSSFEGMDLHILGYFIDPASEPLRVALERFRIERRERALAIMAKLAALSAPVDAEEVFAAAGPGVVGRPHIAHALLKAGHVPTVEAAFQRFLGARGMAFVPRPEFPSAEAVRVIGEAGGVAVLAHPGTLARRIVENLTEAGLTGVEVWHPQHGMAAQKRWYETAKELG
ncbi:MAG: PHP domain-containing protein, partial [Candidatus Eisenbacteria bacterium]|nr:PHP domain-containing protein [Candidatus Eisenbacteria bacterium]